MAKPNKDGLAIPLLYTVDGIITEVQKDSAATTSKLTINLKDSLEDFTVSDAKKFEKDDNVYIEIAVRKVSKKKVRAATANEGA
ncbi:MAG: hypothetical protein U0V70_11370 [Terriglobia bacterium]